MHYETMSMKELNKLREDMEVMSFSNNVDIYCDATKVYRIITKTKNYNIDLEIQTQKTAAYYSLAPEILWYKEVKDFDEVGKACYVICMERLFCDCVESLIGEIPTGTFRLLGLTLQEIGIVHGDLHEGNVFYDEEKGLMLIDFEFAYFSRDESDHNSDMYALYELEDEYEIG